jgi:uncharacterized membrane protein YgcG
MKCFYHPDKDGVGICQQCGKSACRDCIEDIGGAMLCDSCLAREATAQEELAQAEEQRQVLELDSLRRQASRRIRWSYVVAALAAVFYSGFALMAASEKVPLAVPWFLLVFGGPYVIWSIYWGPVWCWPKWRRFIRSIRQGLSGWILIARPFIWLMLFIFYLTLYLSIPLAIAVYYGVFGGGVYQFRKHLRLASGQDASTSTPASRRRNRIIAAAVAVVLLLLFLLNVWQVYRQFTGRPAPSENSVTSLGYISDDAHVLDRRTTATLNQLCAEASENYNTQISTYTLAKLNGRNIQGLAQGLLQQRSGGVGGRRSVVIVLAPNDRAWRIEFGSGFGSTVTNETAQSIGNEARPSLRAGNYGGALLIMVRGVVATLEKEPHGNAGVAPVLQSSPSSPHPSPPRHRIRTPNLSRQPMNLRWSSIHRRMFAQRLLPHPESFAR